MVHRFLVLLVFLAFLPIACERDKTSGEPVRDAQSRRLCPPNFAYHPGGRQIIVRNGSRWGRSREIRYEVDLAPFCLAQFEASQPDATAEVHGAYSFGRDVPPAQVKKGVKPWVQLSWVEAMMAVAQQGWRLPTFEELQMAASGGDIDRLWVYGREWDCKQAERSWFQTCKGLRDPKEGAGVTGGPKGTSNYGTPWFDFLGGVAEMTSTPWDPKCYGFTRFSLFGHAFLAGNDLAWLTEQQADPDKPGCWLFMGFSGNIRGEHEHDYLNRIYRDDGFRPAVDPAEHWAERQLQKTPQPVSFPLTGWYLDRATGEKISYEIPRPAQIATNRTMSGDEPGVPTESLL